MDLVCLACSGHFVCNKRRSRCFLCNPHPNINSPEALIKEYNEGATYEDLCKVYDVSMKTIQSYVRSFGVSRKSTERTVSYYGKPLLDLKWLDGWLLGDGCLKRSGRSVNARGSHGSSYREYCVYVKNRWSMMGISSGRISPCPHKDKEGGIYYSYSVVSHNYPALTDQFNRWYPQGKKHVPSDLGLSPSTLLEWYIGDGSLRGKLPALFMGGVVLEEVEFMVYLLNQVFPGGFCRKDRPQNRKTKSGEEMQPYWEVVGSLSVVSDFFRYIGLCPLPCYLYKWPRGDF